MAEHDEALAGRLKAQAFETTLVYLAWEQAELVAQAADFLATAAPQAQAGRHGAATAARLAARAAQMYRGAADLHHALATLGGERQRRQAAHACLGLADAAQALARDYAACADGVPSGAR